MNGSTTSDSPPARGQVIWLMGPTSAGKTTIARTALDMLRDRGRKAIVFDGDEVRDFFGPGHGFAPEDRLRVVSILVHLAGKSAEAGLDVIVAALTAHDDARRYVRETLSPVLVGYVACAIDVCADRDPKGLYGRARRGEIDSLIGFNTPYEPPENPDIVLPSDSRPVEELAEMVIDLLDRRR